MPECFFGLQSRFSTGCLGETQTVSKMLFYGLAARHVVLCVSSDRRRGRDQTVGAVWSMYVCI